MASVLYQSIETLSRDKGIEPAVVVGAVEDAIALATRKYYKTQENMRAEMDRETGEIRAYVFKTVVETPEQIEDDINQIALEQARELAPEVEVGGELRFYKDTTRIAGSAVGSPPHPNKFPRLSYDEAHAMLEKAYAEGKIEAPHKYGDDFGSPDETYISSQFSKPVMIHRYPAAIKAFYMQPDPLDPTKALCVDVLAPEGYGEIIGGSQRVDSYDLLKSRIEEHGLPLAAFQWYLDLRRYGSVPHSGFGMGIERVVAWLCGLDHVRETIPFARTLNRIYP